MTAPFYVPAPIWPESLLRDFCKEVLRAFPGAKIIVVHRQGPEERQERPPGLAA